MLPEDDILDATPRSLVRKHQAIPLFIDDDRLLVACIDMPEHEVEDEMRLRYGVAMRAVIATPRAISQAISKYYAPGTRDDAKPYAKAAEATTVVSKGGKPASKSSDTAKPKPAAKAAANVPFDQLPEDQKAQRKQIGLIAMAWSILIPCFPLLLYGVWPAARITLRASSSRSLAGHPDSSGDDLLRDPEVLEVALVGWSHGPLILRRGSPKRLRRCLPSRRSPPE